MVLRMEKTGGRVSLKREDGILIGGGGGRRSTSQKGE